MNDCQRALRLALTDRLSAHATTRASAAPETLAQLEADYASSTHGDSLSARVLRLASPNEGLPLLERMLKDDNPLRALEAACALALLGNAAGEQVLLAMGRPKPAFPALTNSQIEAFYAKAGLLLLGLPIPPKLRTQRSVFRDLEALIDRCVDAG